KGGMRLASQPSRFRPRFLQSDHSWIRRLLRGKIFASALSQFFRRLGYVENIVDNLEGEAEGATKRSDGSELFRRHVCGHRAKAHGTRQERRGFVLVNRTNLRAGKLSSFRFEVGDLTGNQFPAAGRCCDFVEDITQVVTRNRLRVRRNLERDRQQSVARQDRNRVSEAYVTRQR